MERSSFAIIEKKALEEGYVIGFIDESAFSHCPYVHRTYNRKGKRAVLKHGPLRGGVQSISMVTPSGGLYFKVKQGTFKGKDVAEFLEALLYFFRSKKLLIIWDGAMTHKSVEVKQLLANKAKGRIHLELIPSHSPQLNVDEQAHGYLKQHKLANRFFANPEQLLDAVKKEFQWLKSQKWLVHNFFFHKDTGFYHS